jgi:hypothetical protein
MGTTDYVSERVPLHLQPSLPDPTLGSFLSVRSAISVSDWRSSWIVKETVDRLGSSIYGSLGELAVVYLYRHQLYKF